MAGALADHNAMSAKLEERFGNCAYQDRVGIYLHTGDVLDQVGLYQHGLAAESQPKQAKCHENGIAQTF
jgi:hypothetical protein